MQKPIYRFFSIPFLSLLDFFLKALATEDKEEITAKETVFYRGFYDYFDDWNSSDDHPIYLYFEKEEIELSLQDEYFSGYIAEKASEDDVDADRRDDTGCEGFWDL